jgi:hypothetical protein
VSDQVDAVTTPEAPEATPPAPVELGHCLGCKRAVELRVTEQSEQGGRFHRKGRLTQEQHRPKAWQEPCGPVVTEWLYHVAYWWEAGPQFGMRRDSMALPAQIEGRPDLLDAIEAQIREGIRAADTKTGAALVGLQAQVTVVSWQRMGWR